MKKVKLLDSAVGKTIIVILYGAVSTGVLFALNAALDIFKANKNDLLAVVGVYLVNIAIVAVKNFRDKNVPNLPK